MQLWNVVALGRDDRRDNRRDKSCVVVLFLHKLNVLCIRVNLDKGLYEVTSSPIVVHVLVVVDYTIL